MSKKTFYITRDSLKALSVFIVIPDERWVNIHEITTYFPNINTHPVVSGLYGIEEFLPFLKIPIGKCWKVEVESTDEKCVINILDKDVYVKTVLRTNRIYDRS